MIEVKVLEDGSFEISWDENDPNEKIFNNFTEQDFIDAIKEGLKNNGTDIQASS
jgi:hypothetical protein